MKFHRTPFFMPWLYPGLTWRKPSESKTLYLTFDDGPVYGPTEFALDTLNEYQASATFFCIGDNIVKHPDVFTRLCEEGHAIGNHTYNHLNGWQADIKSYLRNTHKCQRAIFEHRGQLVKQTANKPLFRPPYGRVTRRQIKALRNYSIIMWDVLTYDFEASLKPETILRESIQATRPGSIIVFHDSLKAEKNLTFVLPRYLQHFTELGYTFQRIEE
jgi:peptidoglycan-N-acetylglucosamine deacetylase